MIRPAQRQVLALGGAVTLVLGLAACGGGDDDSGKPYAGVELNVLMNQHAPTEDFRDTYLAEFEEETGMTVNLDIVPESGLATRTNLALSQGTGEYDVIESGAKTWPQLVGSGWLLPLDEYLEDPDSAEFTDGFSEQLLTSLATDGGTYGIPMFVGGNMLYYNKEMFSAAGLDPDDPPNSTDELVEYAEQLHQPDDGQSGIVVRGTREANANSFSWLMLWLLNGGRWIDADGNERYTDILTEAPALTTAEQWAELAKYAPAGVANYNFNEAQLAMQQGEAAMWLDGAELGPALEDPGASTVAGQIGYHVIEGEGDDYVAGAVWGYSIAETSQNADAAWEFIKYATGKDVGIGQAVSGANAAPARADVLSDPDVTDALVPEYAEALAAVTESVNPNYSPLIPEGGEIRAAMSLALSDILTGADPVAAMESANDEVNAIVGE